MGAKIVDVEYLCGMTIAEGKKQLAEKLATRYDEREAHNIAEMVVEKLTGWDRIKLLLQKNETLSSEQESLLQTWTRDLLRHRPVQYVLGEAWFMGFPFFVAESVLIPRPETEELVQWILETMKGKPGKVLDIGTGSGCIAVSLAKHNRQLQVSAIDKSNEALYISEKNNQKLATSVRFFQMDILDMEGGFFSEKMDVIVSNPPYIKENERKYMHENVLAFEPEMALFVPNTNPLLFYRKIAEIATKSLVPGGHLFFEINEMFGNEVVSLLTDIGFKSVELKKDLQGKDRMVKAIWSVN